MEPEYTMKRLSLILRRLLFVFGWVPFHVLTGILFLVCVFGIWCLRAIFFICGSDFEDAYPDSDVFKNVIKPLDEAFSRLPNKTIT